MDHQILAGDTRAQRRVAGLLDISGRNGPGGAQRIGQHKGVETVVFVAAEP